jgi:hypothetical protein
MTRAAINNLVRRCRFGPIEAGGRGLSHLEEVEAFAVEHE